MTAKYSFTWALGVVQKLKDKYPRATEIVEENLQLDDRKLASYLAHADPLWPELRRLVQWTDGFSKVWHDSCFNERWKQEVRQYYISKLKERIILGIDRAEKQPTL